MQVSTRSVEELNDRSNSRAYSGGFLSNAHVASSNKGDFTNHVGNIIHQQFDMCLKCLGQNMSGVTDLCLKSGMFLSGSGIIA